MPSASKSAAKDKHVELGFRILAVIEKAEPGCHTTKPKAVW